MSLFEEDWTQWAHRKGVVTEFLRLHPMALSVRPARAELHALNYVVDLLRSYEEIRASYHHSWQRSLRKAERQGYQVEISDSPGEEQVEAFLGLYRAAMVRLGAKPWFRFNGETLRRFFSLPDTSLVSVREDDEPVAFSSILRSGKTLFYHLGCSRQSALPGRPNHLLFDTIIRHGQGIGLASLHLGGGSRSLQRFKSQMADSTVPYFIVRRVLDSDAYERLCRENPAPGEGSDFPVYLRNLFR
jgi:hypothetical protein